MRCIWRVTLVVSLSACPPPATTPAMCSGGGGGSATAGGSPTAGGSGTAGGQGTAGGSGTPFVTRADPGLLCVGGSAADCNNTGEQWTAAVCCVTATTVCGPGSAAE